MRFWKLALSIHDFWMHNLLYAPLLSRHPTAVRWTPSCEDAAKINVDTTWNEETRSAFCGVIVGDHEEMVLVGLLIRSLRLLMLLQLRLALACAAQKALKKGLSRVIFEFEYAFIINKFISQTLDLSF